MNKWIGHGNCGSDPKIVNTENGKKVAKFSFATNESYTNSVGEKVTETQWHQIIYWNKLADLCEKYVKKGSSLIIEGKIVYRSYENKEGQTVYITEIIGHNLHFTGSKEAEKPTDAKPAEKKSTAMSDINELPGAAEDDPSYDPFGN
jgi:single-strand DNA-binding protein